MKRGAAVDEVLTVGLDFAVEHFFTVNVHFDLLIDINHFFR